MSGNYEKTIRDFCNYYGIQGKQIVFKNDGKIPVLKVGADNTPVEGLRNIVSLAPRSELSAENNALLDQWVEYGSTHGAVSDAPGNGPRIMKDLNEYLLDKVYFVGHNVGPIDILIYYFIYNLVSNLSFQDKEKYLHACRWFSHVQQNNRARSSRSLVHFSRTRLYV